MLCSLPSSGYTFNFWKAQTQRCGAETRFQSKIKSISRLHEEFQNQKSETVTSCNGLKMTAADGKKRMTDVADTEQLLRIIQSIPSPKAEPFNLSKLLIFYSKRDCRSNPFLS